MHQAPSFTARLAAAAARARALGRRPTAARAFAAILLAAAAPLAAHADSATIAVAANFTAPLEALKKAFEARSPHRLTITSGSTGQLYAQIENGAPFDVLLSADRDHVDRLVAAGHADGSTRFTYA